MMVFLAVLTVGFAYEWKKGALEVGVRRSDDIRCVNSIIGAS